MLQNMLLYKRSCCSTIIGKTFVGATHVAIYQMSYLLHLVSNKSHNKILDVLRFKYRLFKAHKLEVKKQKFVEKNKHTSFKSQRNPLGHYYMKDAADL